MVQEKERFDHIMSNINSKIVYCDQKITDLKENTQSIIDPMKVSHDNLMLKSIDLKASTQGPSSGMKLQVRSIR